MEEELRGLRLELKTARSDVKRYASYALRLQQELAQEKQKSIDTDSFEKDDSDKCMESMDISYWGTKVEESVKKSDAWRRKINRIVDMMDERAPECKEKDSKQVEEGAERTLKMLGPFLLQLKGLIGELGRDNAKLRDMLRARPMRRELVTSQLEVERLQRQMHKLRARVKSSGAKGKDLQPMEDGDDKRKVVKEPSLSDRILEERLLQMLRVNTEDSAVHHKYLNEKLHCYLSLDPASLADRQELTESGVLERVGRLCKDIVASCCYVLEVEEIAELPNCVQRAHQLAHVSTTYQEFVERVEKLLKRFDKDVFYSFRAKFTAKTSCHDALEMIFAHVNDVLVELDARREQMKPPGSKTHEVLLANMKLLQVSRIDQLTPTIRRLVDNMRAEQEFQHDLCELFGLDESANRKQILHVASVLFGELGFLANNAH
ncbi:hypothetical protein V7S43_002579 [Phytophthora oleae]|uniref:Centrosomal protein of 70 kDa n=1 Tax=Phytophthora oleae TaxID=2107226 RepID=A0ABD3G040_9STRA